MRPLAFTLALALAAAPAAAAPPKGPLAGLAFLVGEWRADDGVVPDVHGVSRGRSTIAAEANGAALVRRDRTEVFDAAGKPINAFEQSMLVYAEAGGVKADYVDGEGHVIHYVSAEVVPGQAVTFVSAPGAGPVFRLRYEAKGADAVAVTFGLTPPGGAPFQTIATGTLRRAR
jgi:hypothetical protein